MILGSVCYLNTICHDASQMPHHHPSWVPVWYLLYQATKEPWNPIVPWYYHQWPLPMCPQSWQSFQEERELWMRGEWCLVLSDAMWILNTIHETPTRFTKHQKRMPQGNITHFQFVAAARQWLWALRSAHWHHQDTGPRTNQPDLVLISFSLFLCFKVFCSFVLCSMHWSLYCHSFQCC